MDSVFQVQINRINHFFDELEVSISSDLKNKSISYLTSIIIQDIAVKLIRLLDQVMRSFFDKKITPILKTGLSVDEISKIGHINFPIQENELSTIIGRMKIKDFKSRFPALTYLESLQPHNNPDKKWLHELKMISNEGHIQLTPVTQELYLTLGNNTVKIGKNATVSFYNSKINGIHVNQTITVNTPTYAIDPTLNPKIEWTGISIDITGTDALEFCNQAINGVEVIISDLLQLF